MLYYKDGKKADARKKFSEPQLANMREVCEVPALREAPKGMFSIETRAKLK